MRGVPSHVSPNYFGRVCVVTAFWMGDSGFVIVWDVETQTTIDSMIGATRGEKVAACQVSVACALRIPLHLAMKAGFGEEAMEKAVHSSYWRDKDPEGTGPFEALFRLFDEATLIAGFNTCAFDHIVMRKYYGEQIRRYESHVLKSFDTFSRLRDATGKWYKLDTLLQCNSLHAKTASGLQAIKMWEDGERSELEEYCKNDVAQTARLLMQRELRIPNSDVLIPNHVFGIASACRMTLSHSSSNAS